MPVGLKAKVEMLDQKIFWAIHPKNFLGYPSIKWMAAWRTIKWTVGS